MNVKNSFLKPTIMKKNIRTNISKNYTINLKIQGFNWFIQSSTVE